MKTKAELQHALDDREVEVLQLTKQLQTSQAETRRFQNDANRESNNAKDFESRLKRIRYAIEAHLQAKYDVGVTAKTEWIRNEEVPTEDVCEEVRMLRHLAEITMFEPPF